MARQSACAANQWCRLVIQLSAFLLVVLALEPIPAVSLTPGLESLAMEQSLSKQRIRRRVGGMDVTTGAIEYMEKLREKMSNSGPVDSETNVWCILDKDLVKNAYRPKTPSQRCTAINHYIYSLKSVVESEDAYTFPLTNTIIRAYLQVIPRLVKSQPTRVNITITAKLQNQDTSEYVFAGRHEIDVTAESNGFLELNVTEGVNKLWPLVVNNGTITAENCNIEFLIKLEVDCKKTKKVPANFVEPTSIKLSQTKRRQRYAAFQALLLVFMNEEERNEIMREEEREANSMAESQEESRKRVSRSAGSSSVTICQREDFSIQFSDLQLDYVLAPLVYNAYRCSGSCSHEVLSTNDHLGTNHAKLMASAKLVSEIPNSGAQFAKQPRDPCCTPTKYTSIPLLISRGNDSLKVVGYPAMIVTECGCR